MKGQPTELITLKTDEWVITHTIWFNCGGPITKTRKQSWEKGKFTFRVQIV